ncbi:hypothetical protein NE237_032464 [Protea cynaroides]|uniref:Myb/SANT-like domain-containing protein n=1 Tax=Protea cynaroides TaxID=273540 RepID=A0A9Q0R3H9_9MAGN|nr:hypothetical protein NE237_032464 [Protea cynaroides]
MDHGKAIVVSPNGDATGPKESYCWTEERIKLLLDIALDYSRKGYKLNTHFTKDGWARILKDYNQKSNKNITMQQLKNRWNVLKAMWVAWVALKNHGWEWNTALGTIVPPSKEHWNAYVKKHCNGRHFKNAPLRNEEELRELFYGVAADGDGAICTNEDQPPALTKGVTASNSAVNEDEDNSSDDDILPVELSNMKEKKKQKSKRSMGSLSKRSKNVDDDDMGETLKRIIALEEQRRAVMIEAKKDTTLKEAIQILNSLEGIELGSNHHVLALEVLEDRTKREMFITMHESARIPWLLRAIQRKVKEDELI